MHRNVGETSRRVDDSGDERTLMPRRSNANRALRRATNSVQRPLAPEKRLRFVERERKRDLSIRLLAPANHCVRRRYRDQPSVAGRILPHLIAHTFCCALQERNTQFWVPHNTTLRRILRKHASVIPSRYQTKPASARDHIDWRSPHCQMRATWRAPPSFTLAGLQRPNQRGRGYCCGSMLKSARQAARRLMYTGAYSYQSNATSSLCALS